MSRSHSNLTLTNGCGGDEMTEKKHDGFDHCVDTVCISSELFDRLSHLRAADETGASLPQTRTLGNPAPIALVGFIIGATPLACELMGWRGANVDGGAGLPTYFFFGGGLQLIGGFLEWIMGETFQSVVFCAFGAYFLSFAGSLSPAFGAYASYAPEGQPAAAGMTAPGFKADFGFLTLWMGLLCMVFLVCALRTHLCNVLVQFTVVLTFMWLTVSHWLVAEGNTALAAKFVTAAGATLMISAALGWWIFVSVMLDTLEFPVRLPLGDLTYLIKPPCCSKVSRHAQPGEV